MSELIAIQGRSGAGGELSPYGRPLWYAGYTAARHEKRVAQHLSQRGVEHFLPLYEAVHRWNNGCHRVSLPLFPGYIFVRIPLRERMRVLEVPGFVRLVGFNALPQPLSDADIEKMKNALSSGVVAEPYPYLTAGTRVEVRRGPLAGMTGILLRRQNKYRVVISVDLIQRAMVVEVAAEDVAPIRKSVLRAGQTDRTRDRSEHSALSFAPGVMP